MDENILGNVVGSLIDNNKDRDWGNGGCFMWFILLLFLGGGMGGFGWGNRAGNIATTQDVAGATAYNQVDNGIRGLERGQSNLGYNILDKFGRTDMLVQGVGNNMERAITESTFATKDCCCTTNRNIDAAKYDVTRNIDALRYDTSLQTCSINEHADHNQREILAAINDLKMSGKDEIIANLRSDLQAAQLTLAQGVQTQNIVGALKMPAPVPAYVVANPFCNCGNGYSNYGGTVIA